MIKFLLGFVAVIVVLLTAYMFLNKPSQTPKKETISKVGKQDVSKTKIAVSEVTQKVKEEKTSSKKVSTKSQKVVSHEPNKEIVENEDEIGKGLTLESIENADVSDEEKEHMRYDFAYDQAKHTDFPEPLSEEEMEKVVEEDIKNGLIQ